MRPMQGEYYLDGFKAMLSVEIIMGCLSCIAQMCFGDTQKYGTLMAQRSFKVENVYRLCYNDMKTQFLIMKVDYKKKLPKRGTLFGWQYGILSLLCISILRLGLKYKRLRVEVSNLVCIRKNHDMNVMVLLCSLTLSYVDLCSYEPYVGDYSLI